MFDTILDSGVGSNELSLASGGWLSPLLQGYEGMQRFENEFFGGTTITGNSRWTTSFGADQEAFIGINKVPTLIGTTVGLYLRIANPNTNTETGYFLRLVHDGTALRQYDYFRIDTGQVFNALGASVVGPTLTVGDALGCAASGSTLTVYTKQGAGAWTALDAGRTDATYSSSGLIGFGATTADYGGTADIRMVNFGGGTTGGVGSLIGGHHFSRLRRW